MSKKKKLKRKIEYIEKYLAFQDNLNAEFYGRITMLEDMHNLSVKSLKNPLVENILLRKINKENE